MTVLEKETDEATWIFVLYSLRLFAGEPEAKSGAAALVEVVFTPTTLLWNKKGWCILTVTLF